MSQFLYDYQREAVSRMRNGCILNGTVGSGKSRTGLYYYFQLYGGKIDGAYTPMTDPPDLYIITTAKKRDDKEWDLELAPFLLSVDPDICYYNNKVVIDSWNNIKKYADVKDSFFIFDEDRVTGSGAWVRAFLKIAKVNQWIILSATPGDQWLDYIPVFIANGFYKNKTEFNREHVIYRNMGTFWKVDRYVNTGRLLRLRNRILVDMKFQKSTDLQHNYISCEYDQTAYKEAIKTRWNPFLDKPIENASEYCSCLRRIVNSDVTRPNKLLEILSEHPRVIIFYNYDYELDILRGVLSDSEVVYSEWNGHKHEDVPSGEKWAYLVQYNAGNEGWNCIKTDTMIFYSQNYSYRIMKQAEGRIDRVNTPFSTLYYYHFTSKSSIDKGISNALRVKKKFNESKFAGADVFGQL